MNAAAGADVFIHPTSVVEAGATLAPGVRVGPFCTVGAQVALEAGWS